PENEEVRIRYLEYKKKLVKLIRNAKYNFYKKQINKNKDTPKNLWNVVNKLRKGSSKCAIKEIVDENKLYDSPKTIANQFNDFFVNIGKYYAELIVRPNKNRPQRKINQSTFFLEAVDVTEVTSIINTLKKWEIARF
ncbi:unnamed protein product, partial [Acanthoscelides obtectus]